MNEQKLKQPVAQEPVLSEAAPVDEVLVSDARAGLTPAQMVERRLVSLLESTPLPVSRMQASVQKRAFR